MVTKQKVRVTFRPNPQREKDGLTPIYMRLFVDSRKTELYSDHSIPMKYWNSSTKRVKGTIPYSKIGGVIFYDKKEDVEILKEHREECPNMILQKKRSFDYSSERLYQ